MKQKAKPTEAKTEKDLKQKLAAAWETVTGKAGALLQKLKQKIRPEDKVKRKKKKEVEEIVPNTTVWTVVITLILAAAFMWQLNNLSGWFNGNTMVEQYGMDPVMADAVTKCPDILFYATYYSAALSFIALVVTAFAGYRYLINKMSGYVAVNIAAIGVLSIIWSFPFVHAIVDLAATPMPVLDSAGIARDTHMFDVFQLGIQGWPLVVGTAVCCFILWVNKRIDSLID